MGTHVVVKVALGENSKDSPYISVVFITLFAILMASPAQAGPQVTETVLSPSLITDATGSHSGSVSARATKDQTGAQNNPTKYVQFGLPSRQLYQGYQSFFLASTISPSTVTTVALMANVRAEFTVEDLPWTPCR